MLVPLLIVSLSGCKISYITESTSTNSSGNSILSEESATSQNSSIESVTSEPISQNSETSEIESTEQISQSEETSTISSQSESSLEERVKTVHFFNNSLMPSTGSNFEHESNLAILVSIFNQIESDFITSDGILLEKCQSFKCDDSLVLQVGTGTAHGGFIFESNYLIKSAKIESSVYYKDPYQDTWTDPENPYWIYPVDNYVEVNVNDDVQSITHESTDKPERHDLKFDFDTPTNEFSLFTTESSQRMFIYSIEFTYLA